MEYENSLKDKTAIITGANCGIGYETALDFAKRGARVIIACRSQSKADEACKLIKTESKNQNVEFELLDLASLKSTREFCERILKKLERLDILVNNAGLGGIPYSKTEEGVEMIFVVNYLSHYLLTRLLLDLLKKSAPSRIVNVSSIAHKLYGIEWESFDCEGRLQAYSQSKLAQILFTIELEKRLKGTGVSAVSLHPGVVKQTELCRKREEDSLFGSVFMTVMRQLIRIVGTSVADGAKTTIHCATHPDIPSQSGSYYDNCKVAAVKYANPSDRESTEKLWNMSAKLVELDPNDEITTEKNT